MSVNEYESNDEAEIRLLQQISQQCAEYLNCYDSERITGTHEYVSHLLWRIGQAEPA